MLMAGVRKFLLERRTRLNWRCHSQVPKCKNPQKTHFHKLRIKYNKIPNFFASTTSPTPTLGALSALQDGSAWNGGDSWKLLQAMGKRQPQNVGRWKNYAFRFSGCGISKHDIILKPHAWDEDDFVGWQSPHVLIIKWVNQGFDAMRTDWIVE